MKNTQITSGMWNYRPEGGWTDETLPHIEEGDDFVFCLVPNQMRTSMPYMVYCYGGWEMHKRDFANFDRYMVIPKETHA